MKAKPRGRRYRSLYAFAALVLALGCAKKPAEPEPSRVQPYGNDLIVSYSSIWGYGAARAASIAEANRFCADRGLRMMPVQEDKASGIGRSVALIFRCVSADDPELRGGGPARSAP